MFEPAKIIAFLKEHETLILPALWCVGAVLIFIRGVVSVKNIKIYAIKLILWWKVAFEEDGKTSSKRLTAFGVFSLLAYAVYKAVNRDSPGSGVNDVDIIWGLGSTLCAILGIVGYVATKKPKSDS